MNAPELALPPSAEAVAAAAPDAPPRPPFVLAIGISGHRKQALPEDSLDALEQRIRRALALVREGAAAAHKQESAHYSDEPATLRFISPLADGSDQIAAQVALDLGFQLHVILPFGRDRYRSDLADDEARTRFDELFAQATCTLELPGEADNPLEAYVMTGRATVAHCDLLLAIWDGLAPRGRGGTGEVVELAVVNGTPVVHVPVDPDEPERLLWSAFDPAVVTHRVEKTDERPLDQQHLAVVLTALFAPPEDSQERRFLSIFFRERLRRIRARIEYPLLLAAAGISRFDRRKLRVDRGAAEIREEWIRFRQSCAEPNEIAAPLDLLESCYSWADQLGTHFAQTYRSGHIFNFVLGAVAICIGLSGFMAPGALLQLAIAEAVITLGIILNTRIGVKNEWHRRWLDYRQLAERLRPMRSLKLLGLAAPDPPGTQTNPIPLRWIDWYAIAVWRALGCPAGSLDPARAARLGQAIAAYEIAPQVAYHHRHARQIEMLDARLEKIAGILFMATLAVTAIVTIGLAFGSSWVEQYGDWFTLVSAGFPALGTAVFGIRFQGDFGGSAKRSESTAEQLDQIADELAIGVGLARASDLTEQAARIMLADLDEWRLVNQQQELDLT